MASKSQQRVARPDVGRQTVPHSGCSHRKSACRQCSLCTWYSTVQLNVQLNVVFAKWSKKVTVKGQNVNECICYYQSLPFTRHCGVGKLLLSCGIMCHSFSIVTSAVKMHVIC